MQTKRVNELRPQMIEVLLAAGTKPDQAEVVADHMLTANLSGVDTHGFRHLELYLNEVRAGSFDPGAVPAILTETPSTALIDGNLGWGIAAGKYAMDVAIEKARETGVAMVSVVHCDHMGRLGCFVEQAMEANMASSVWVGGLGVERPLIAPHGGAEPLLSGNPIAFGFPGKETDGVMVDFSAMGYLLPWLDRDQRNGVAVPEGVLIDGEGRPTTDTSGYDAATASFSAGAMLPFGQHKGSGILLALEAFGRVLTGAENFADPERGCAQFRHQGTLFLVMNAAAFQPVEQFHSTLDGLVGDVHAVKPQEGVARVLVPGDREAAARAERAEEGFPVPDDIWASYVAAAASYGVTVE